MSDTIKLAWWNTSLSPARVKSRSSSVTMGFVLSVIDKLLITEGVDILSLCEVSADDVKKIELHLAGSGYAVINGTRKIPYTRFDLCTIYNTIKLDVVSEKTIDVPDDINTLKLGHSIRFSFVSSSGLNQGCEDFYLIASHWPSQKNCKWDSPVRVSHARKLLEEVKYLIKNSGTPYVVLMGDYNDEPYSYSMEQYLHATRDIEKVKKGEKILYNTSWRHVGRHTECINPVCGTPHINTGTIYYPDAFTDWKVYDQIIVSMGFICSSGWKLKDMASQIYNEDTISSEVRVANGIFDHLPIWAEIYR